MDDLADAGNVLTAFDAADIVHIDFQRRHLETQGPAGHAHEGIAERRQDAAGGNAPVIAGVTADIKADADAADVEFFYRTGHTLEIRGLGINILKHPLQPGSCFRTDRFFWFIHRPVLLHRQTHKGRLQRTSPCHEPNSGHHYHKNHRELPWSCDRCG